MEPRVEERVLAIEVISTLVRIKHHMAERILKPAGIPPETYQPILARRDEATGWRLAKRQVAPLILDSIKTLPNYARIVRSIIRIAAKWSDFHLAEDEYQARATVQKAREMLGTIELMEAREAKQHDLAKQEEAARLEQIRATQFIQESRLLLMMFDELAGNSNAQRRGYLLQDLLNRVFDLHDIPIHRSFIRNGGGEQIDGAFRLDGWYYLVECRWREKLADIRELDGLRGQINRSGKQTMGLFLSINGWSENVRPLLKQNPDKSIILMDGYDLRVLLETHTSLRDFILAKVARLNLEAEPYLGIREYLPS